MFFSGTYYYNSNIKNGENTYLIKADIIHIIHTNNKPIASMRFKYLNSSFAKGIHKKHIGMKYKGNNLNLGLCPKTLKLKSLFFGLK